MYNIKYTFKKSLKHVLYNKYLLCVYINFLFFFIIPYNLVAQTAIKPCQKEPDFIKTLGYDPLWTALSTSEKKLVGIALIEFDQVEGLKAPTPTTPKKSIYQADSWKSFGYLSSIAFDINGNAYTIPTPLISMLYNPSEKLNTIYQLNAYTGVLAEWFNLPYAAKINTNNPYGLLGITYDCTANLLIASTVAGSDRYQQKGILYLIDVSTKKIIDTLNKKDAIAVAVAFDENKQKRLYFGSARNGDIFSIPINNQGKLIKSKSRKELSLEGFGPRGDDKARKIKMIDGALIINGVAFNYNLQASSEKPETVYTFKWNQQNKKWDLVDFK
jgi:hypothetical protein